MPTSCRRMFALKRSSTPKSRRGRRGAAVDRQNQNMELPITLRADHPLRLGNFTSAHLGTFESALTAAADWIGAGRENDGDAARLLSSGKCPASDNFTNSTF